MGLKKISLKFQFSSSRINDTFTKLLSVIPADVFIYLRTTNSIFSINVIL